MAWEFDVVERLGLLWSIAGVFTFLAVVTSTYLIYKHMRHYTQPHLQRYIVRILLMVPIYAVDSFLSFRFISLSLYFDLIRDAYEAYVIYNFFTLLVAFVNTYDYETVRRKAALAAARAEREESGAEAPAPQEGLEWDEWDEWLDEQEGNRGSGAPVVVSVSEDAVVALLERKPLASHPFPTCFLPQFQPGKRFLTVAKRCVFQFVVIKPLLALIAIFLELKGWYGDGEWRLDSGYLYLLIVDNISVTLAMYFLVLFFHVMKDELKPFNPVPKFLCIKSVILFAFWQGIIISFLSWFGVLHGDLDLGWTTRDVTVGLQDFLICIEMFFVSLAHSYSFGYRTFRSTEPSWSDLIPCYACLCCLCCCCEITKNFSDVVSQRDVLEDGVETFAVKEMPTKIKGAGAAGASKLAHAGKAGAAQVKTWSSSTFKRMVGSSEHLDDDLDAPLQPDMVEMEDVL